MAAPATSSRTCWGQLGVPEDGRALEACLPEHLEGLRGGSRVGSDVAGAGRRLLASPSYDYPSITNDLCASGPVVTTAKRGLLDRDLDALRDLSS